MSYRITIEEIKTVSYKKQEYENLWTDAVFKSEILPALRKKMKDGDSEPRQYGYVEVDSTREETKKIYQQDVDTLKLPEVIKAINSL